MRTVQPRQDGFRLNELSLMDMENQYFYPDYENNNECYDNSYVDYYDNQCYYDNEPQVDFYEFNSEVTQAPI